MRLLGNDDAASTFIKLPNILKILANTFGVPAINAQIKQIADQIVKGVFLETNWAGLPYTGKLRADILSILKMFGFAEEFDDQLVLGDAVVIARVLEDAALRLVGKPYFHDASRGQMPEQQVKDLLVNMVAFSRQYWAQLDFKKPFPEHMRHLVTEPMLWLVQEDLTVGAISLKLLMPYIVFPNAYLAEIDDQLNGIATYNSIDVTVSDLAYIEAPLIVKESSSFDCKDFITRMRRDYGSKTLYNSSVKNGVTTIHDAYTVPTITFHDHEKFHFGKKLNVKASNNIVNDAGRIFADVMHFQAKGDMYNSGQMCFVDSLKANINGSFSNDIIVVTEYDEVNGVKGTRTYTGHAARNAIKANSGQILAIGDGKGLFDVKTGKDFNHRGIIDVNDVKIVANGNLKIENLPDQFVVRWDPGAGSKKGMDCFSIASQFTPSEIRARDGSVKLVVGGDATVYASLLAAADDIIVEAKGFIKAEAKGESYLGNVSIENGRRNRTIKQESDIIIQKVQVVANGNVRMIAHKNVNIKGGDIVAGLEVEIVGENINLTPIQLIAENKVKEYGSRGFSYYKNNMTYSTSNVATTDIHANSIKLSAKHDVNIKASMLMAMEDITINAGNNITIVEELVEHYVHSKSFSAHLNFFGKRAMDRVLKKDMRGATRAFAQEFGILNQMNRLIKAKHGPDVAIESVKSILDLYKEYQAIDKMGFVNYCKKAAVEKLLSSSASLEFSQEKQQWFEAILPVMRAKNILMKAGNNINLRGLQAKAETMSLEAKGNIDIRAAQEYYNYHKKIRTLEVHTSANFDPVNNEFLLPNVGFSAGYQSCSNHGVRHKNSHIVVDRFEARTPNTLTLEGATIKATDVKIIANALLMKSLVDTESGRNKAISGGLDLNLANGQLSGHVEGSKGSYSKAKVNEQTGITALGEFIAEIGDLTHLQGAYIDAVNSTLKTARFLHNNVEEYDRSKQTSFDTGSFNIKKFDMPGSKKDAPAKQDQNNAPKTDFGITDVGFSRNSLFALVDASYQSKNQKGVLKAGASSGVQIVTQSDIGNLNRDLSQARELVKDHKHYVRVLVPVGDPSEFIETLKEMFSDVQGLFQSAETKRERQEIKAYKQIFDAIEERDDLTQTEKVQAFQAASNVLNQMKEIQRETASLEKDISKIEDNFFSKTKETTPHVPVEIKVENQPGCNGEDGCYEVHITRGHYDYTKGTLHSVAKKIRYLQNAYEDFKESQPKWLRNTLNAAMGVAGFCAGGPLKKIGQKLATIAVAEGLHIGADDLLDHIEHSDSDRIADMESFLRITRKDTLTFTGLFLGVAIYKATPGGTSKAALKAKERKFAREQHGDTHIDGGKAHKINPALLTGIAKIRYDWENFVRQKLVEGFKFERHHIVPKEYAKHDAFKLAGTHVDDKMNLV
ncbi:MAG: hemagglutinin repeat-containing protein [Alphaproteobacteria bacterium]|nr:hemagglutinin repeat-containing protein [Alphaproteobacteria bacterium]